MFELWVFGRAFVLRLIRNDIGAFAAALTYNLLFALFPLALALTAVVPSLHLAAAQQALLIPISAVVSPEVISLIKKTTAYGGRVPSPSLAYAGAAGYVWGMSAAFRRLTDAFNHAYQYRPPLRRAPWKTALLSVLLALTLGIGLVAAMLGATIGQHLTRAFFPAAGALEWLALSVVRWLTLLVLAMVMLAVLYWVAPDQPRAFRWLSPGAVVAIGVWLVISFGFSQYLYHFNSYNFVYGGVGAVILLLLYLYFLSYALLIGAELNAMLEDRHSMQQGGGAG